MSSSFEPPRSGGSYGGSTSATAGSTGRAESVRDAIPDAEPIHGAHETYAKGEVGSIGGLVADISNDLSTLMRQEVALAKAEVQESAPGPPAIWLAPLPSGGPDQRGDVSSAPAPGSHRTSPAEGVGWNLPPASGRLGRC